MTAACSFLPYSTCTAAPASSVSRVTPLSAAVTTSDDLDAIAAKDKPFPWESVMPFISLESLPATNVTSRCILSDSPSENVSCTSTFASISHNPSVKLTLQNEQN